MNSLKKFVSLLLVNSFVLTLTPAASANLSWTAVPAATESSILERAYDSLRESLRAVFSSVQDESEEGENVEDKDQGLHFRLSEAGEKTEVGTTNKTVTGSLLTDAETEN